MLWIHDTSHIMLSTYTTLVAHESVLVSRCAFRDMFLCFFVVSNYIPLYIPKMKQYDTVLLLLSQIIPGTILPSLSKLGLFYGLIKLSCVQVKTLCPLPWHIPVNEKLIWFPEQLISHLSHHSNIYQLLSECIWKHIYNFFKFYFWPPSFLSFSVHLHNLSPFLCK